MEGSNKKSKSTQSFLGLFVLPQQNRGQRLQNQRIDHHPKQLLEKNLEAWLKKKIYSDPNQGNSKNKVYQLSHITMQQLHEKYDLCIIAYEKTLNIDCILNLNSVPTHKRERKSFVFGDEVQFIFVRNKVQESQTQKQNNKIPLQMFKLQVRPTDSFKLYDGSKKLEEERQNKDKEPNIIFGQKQCSVTNSRYQFQQQIQTQKSIIKVDNNKQDWNSGQCDLKKSQNDNQSKNKPQLDDMNNEYCKLDPQGINNKNQQNQKYKNEEQEKREQQSPKNQIYITPYKKIDESFECSKLDQAFVQQSDFSQSVRKNVLQSSSQGVVSKLDKLDGYTQSQGTEKALLKYQGVDKAQNEKDDQKSKIDCQSNLGTNIKIEQEDLVKAITKFVIQKQGNKNNIECQNVKEQGSKQQQQSQKKQIITSVTNENTPQIKFQQAGHKQSDKIEKRELINEDQNYEIRYQYRSNKKNKKYGQYNNMYGSRNKSQRNSHGSMYGSRYSSRFSRYSSCNSQYSSKKYSNCRRAEKYVQKYRQTANSRKIQVLSIEHKKQLDQPDIEKFDSTKKCLQKEQTQKSRRIQQQKQIQQIIGIAKFQTVSNQTNIQEFKNKNSCVSQGNVLLKKQKSQSQSICPVDQVSQFQDTSQQFQISNQSVLSFVSDEKTLNKSEKNSKKQITMQKSQTNVLVKNGQYQQKKQDTFQNKNQGKFITDMKQFRQQQLFSYNHKERSKREQQNKFKKSNKVYNSMTQKYPIIQIGKNMKTKKSQQQAQQNEKKLKQPCIINQQGSGNCIGNNHGSNQQAQKKKIQIRSSEWFKYLQNLSYAQTEVTYMGQNLDFSFKFEEDNIPSQKNIYTCLVQTVLLINGSYKKYIGFCQGAKSKKEARHQASLHCLAQLYFGIEDLWEKYSNIRKQKPGIKLPQESRNMQILQKWLNKDEEKKKAPKCRLEDKQNLPDANDIQKYLKTVKNYKRQLYFFIAQNSKIFLNPRWIIQKPNLLGYWETQIYVRYELQSELYQYRFKCNGKTKKSGQQKNSQELLRQIYRDFPSLFKQFKQTKRKKGLY